MKIVSSVTLGTIEPPKIFTREELDTWHKPKLWRLILDLIGPWFQIACALTLITIWWNPISWVIAYLLIGGAQHAFGLITHELGHKLVFPDNKKLNDFLGTWVYGGAAALPFRFYVDRHLDHHRYVSTEDDTKRLYRRDFSNWHIARELLLGISGYDYLFQITSVLWRHKKQRDTGSEQKTYLADFAAVILVQLLIFEIYLFFTSYWFYIFFWLLPLITVGTLLAKLRSSVEHQPLASEYGHGIYYMGTELPLYRTVRATWFERIFLTRINFNYHIEHHLWPTISYQYLPQVHARLYKHRNLPEPPGYLRVLYELWKQNPNFLDDRDYLDLS